MQMDPLTWTGALDWMNPLLGGAVLVVLLGIAMQMVWPLLPTSPAGVRRLGQLTTVGIAAATALLMVYVVGGVFMGAGAGIFGGMAQRLLPVWIALIVTFALSITFKRRLGLYGKLFDSTVGMIGFGLVMFWVYTGLFGGVFDMIVTHDSLSQTSGMKNKLPGTPLARAEDGDYPWFLLGGDNLARDVFSRLIKGAWVVIQIAPMATVFAFMVGITLGLPAGYYGGKLDVFLSFLANLILAFPVILIFYLLVTPEIVLTGLPNYMAIVLFIFPLVFLGVLLNTRLRTQPGTRTPVLVVVLGLVGWLYLAMISDDGRWCAPRPTRSRACPRFWISSTSGRGCWWSLSRWFSSMRPQYSGSCAGSHWTSRHATTWRPRRPAAKDRGTSCYGRSCPMPAAP